MSAQPRDPARDRKVRIAVYGGLTTVLVLLVAISWYLGRESELGMDQAWADVDYASLPEVQLLQEYVRADTSPGTGSEYEGALFLARQFETAGITAHVERLGDKSANMWAILEGRSSEAVVLHNHIDVFDIVEPEKWDFPPFEAVLDKAWLYGRGVFDMKSVAVAQMLALLDLAATGKQPERSVIFLATGSEEVGSELGTRWILEQHPELASRFWAVFTEGGIVEPINQEVIKYWGTEFAQKRFAELWACSSERQRLEELGQDLEEWDNADFALEIVPEVEAFIAAYAASRTLKSIEESLSEFRAVTSDPNAFFEMPNYLRALFRSEIVPFSVEEAPGGGFRMRLLLHLLPGADFAEVRDRLLPEWATHDVTLTPGRPLGATHGSPLDHEAYLIQLALLEETFPETLVGPYFLSWSATDARFFREHGIPAYGFTPFLVLNTDTFRIDTINERISLPGYVGGVELYKKLLRRLAG